MSIPKMTLARTDAIFQRLLKLSETNRSKVFCMAFGSAQAGLDLSNTLRSRPHQLAEYFRIIERHITDVEAEAAK